MNYKDTMPFTPEAMRELYQAAQNYHSKEAAEYRARMEAVMREEHPHAIYYIYAASRTEKHGSQMKWRISYNATHAIAVVDGIAKAFLMDWHHPDDVLIITTTAHCPFAREYYHAPHLSRRIDKADAHFYTYKTPCATE